MTAPKSGTEILIGTVCRALGLDPNAIVAQINGFGQTLASIAQDFATVRRDIQMIKRALNMEAADNGPEHDNGSGAKHGDGEAGSDAGDGGGKPRALPARH